MAVPFYQIIQSGNTADIFIFGNISEWEYEDLGQRSAHGLAAELQNLDVETINVHIDSYGGSVKEAWGMYQALVHHKATINTYADGFVASAALYPYLAGEKRYASSLSAFYLHKVIGGASGYAEDLRKAADEIDFMTNTGINAFVEVAGMDKDNVLALMEAETWLTAEAAKTNGIVTDIVTNGKNSNFGQCVQEQIIKQLMNTPGASPAPKTQGQQTPPSEKNNFINFLERI